MTKNSIYISIIIPTFKREIELENCLKNLLFSIEKITLKDYEIIISDDDYQVQNESYYLQKNSSIIYLKGPQKGPAANRNFAAAIAKGSWLIFLDDDCLPLEDFISSNVDLIKQNFNLIEGKTITDRKRKRFDEVAPINEFGNKLWSCNFAIKNELFKELGGFDENFQFSTMEDIDFKIRAEKIQSIKFNPLSIVIHPWRQRKAFKNILGRLKSQKYFRSKHQSELSNYRIDRIKIFIGSIFYNFIELMKYKGRGWQVYFEKIIFNFLMIFN
jgi:GT2 family glycosyltransferase